MAPSGFGARRGGAVRPPGARVVEVPDDWGLVGASSCAPMEISTSSLHLRRSYERCGPDNGDKPGGRAGTEDLEGAGAAAEGAPTAEGARLPTELDAAENERVNPEESDDGGVAPEKQYSKVE